MSGNLTKKKKLKEEGKNTQCIKADPVQTYYQNSHLNKYLLAFER